MPTSAPTVRPSQDSDLPAICAIYTHHVLHGTGTFELTAPDQQEMAHRRADVLSKGLPWLVVEDAGQLLGYAYCQWFKPRLAYRYAAEDSIYLAPQAQGQGLGKLLMHSLCTQAQSAGLRKLIALIGDSANAGSIGLHRACGFTQVGVLSNCGWKFDRWLDVVIMERTLGAGASTTPVA